MAGSTRLLRALWGHLVVTLALGGLGANLAEAVGHKQRKGRKHVAAGKAAAMPPATAPPAAADPDGEHKAARFSSLDLRPHADLRRVKFPAGTDLSGKNLRGADLTGASLANVIMRGTKLDGAKLFGADIRGAEGIDLSKAELHPFFQPQGGEPVGHRLDLELSEHGLAANSPCQVAFAPRNRALYHLSKDGLTLDVFSTTGASYGLVINNYETPDGAPIADRHHGIVLDAQERIWLLGEGRITILDAHQALSGQNRMAGNTNQGLPLQGRPLAAAFDAQGWLWISLPGHLVIVRQEPGDPQLYHSDIFVEGAGEGTRFLPLSQAGDWFAGVDPARDELLVGRPDQGKPGSLRLPPGSRPQNLAQGAGGEIWCTLSGLGALARIDLGPSPDRPSTWKVAYFPLPDRPGETRRPYALALGEDGNIWYTDPGAGRVGRITGDGDLQEFPLEPGLAPTNLLCARDGRMFYTMLFVPGVRKAYDRPLLGSIRTVPVPERTEPEKSRSEPAPETKSGRGGALGFEVEPFRCRPSPARKRPTLEQKRQRPVWGVGAAPEPGPVAQADAGPEPEDAGSEASAAPPQALRPGRKPAVEPAPAAQVPVRITADREREAARERLKALGVVVTPQAVEAILRKHGHLDKAEEGRAHPEDPGESEREEKSRFPGEYSTHLGFLNMLADGLPGIRLGTHTSREGRVMTYFQVPIPGLSSDGETHTVRLISRQVNGLHYVDNAFPVPE
jgi:streptogramin lyase